MSAPNQGESGLRESLTVLFADITGSTTLFEKSGDARAKQLIDRSFALLIAKIEETRGTLVKTIGDEVMAWFGSADDAIQAAVDMQRAHEHEPLKIRVGLHFGPVIRDKKDLFGDTVNTASRLTKWAAVGEIITTGDTVERLSPPVRQQVVDLGSTLLSGKDKPLHVFRVSWRQDEPTLDETVFGGGREAVPASREVRLLLVYDDAEYWVDRARPGLSIGKHESNGLVVSGEYASRNHAKLECRSGRFKWTDQSKNGSFIVDEAGHLRLVRRDAVELTGSGLIGLGREPVPGSLDVIRFRCAFQEG